MDLQMRTVQKTPSFWIPLPQPLKLTSVPWPLLCILKVTLQSQALGGRSPKSSSVSD